MTNAEAIKVLLNEWKCIDRNDGINCDRKCESCDLVMDVQTIREAFNMAISALQAQDSPKPTAESVQNVQNEDLISRKAAIDAIRASTLKYTGFMEMEMYTDDDAVEAIEELPSAQPEWNNHTFACILAELFDDTCACNYNGIDEWLPSKCELLDSCPNPVGVACWEQYLKHRAERRTDEGD